ncbi:MAG: carbamoyl-phosphate synthase large subunit [Planctomycetaceae bacterium]|nr:carbamoyl-phosphate synthase large subunit [Planctomycetaceae bacterium]
MPKRTDISTILIIGSGPIIIGQACEFDYSGTQACRALRAEGYRVVLINSNPATIMTDPEMADATYVEPIVPEVIEKIIAKERPDALLPTLGGQTALNAAVALHKLGILKKYNVEMIGAKFEAIEKAEDRGLFKQAMQKIGIAVPRSGTAHTYAEAETILAGIGLPVAIRPGFTMGGTGGGIAFNKQEFEEIVQRGLRLSPTSEVLIEEYLAGWKEYELEVMRDHADNVVIICSIENVDPMGVHTGDSVTVAPAQTLTDKEYQILRDASLKIIREIGVDTGGSNIQFAVDPKTGRYIVIEMNPRVSRSSALASKATGFPIAKFAAKLAVGYTLEEIKNDITKKTPACFEPTIDYCVVKAPRWAFEKFPGSDTRLTTQMKSVGETMAIGRTFKEALQKALRGLETGRAGLGADPKDSWLKGLKPSRAELKERLIVPGVERLFAIRLALKTGMTVSEISSHSGIDPWFVENIREIISMEDRIRSVGSLDKLDDRALREAKRFGFSDVQLATLLKTTEKAVRKRRKDKKITPVYKSVDTCAAEFEAQTPYYYSTYEQFEELEVKPGTKRVMILGGGPNRIGQGIEFDYCCVHAAFACADLGIESIMVNSNPETVSTDYDVSNHLFFEPLTAEDVLNICDKIKPDGVIVQFGGQTPLNLARRLHDEGVPLLGTPVESIEAAEDRKLFNKLCDELDIRQPPGATATNADDAARVAARIGYPVLVRPSFVLGGRAMEIVYDEASLRHYMTHAVEVSEARPVLVDHYLDNAVEVDVDCIADGESSMIAGIMEHVEYAGVHSGDSTCSIPPQTLSDDVINTLTEWTHRLARRLGVIGLMNVQYAVKGSQCYILEANPRASRTVPYVAKAIGQPIARYAAKAMMGMKLKDLGFEENLYPPHCAIKKPVFPFNKFPGADVLLGPEMRSTGEVMGVGATFGEALFKSQLGAGAGLPPSGTVFLSVKDEDKPRTIEVARLLHELGYQLVATRGTATAIEAAGIPVRVVNKVKDGRPHIVDLLKNGEVALVITTVAENRSQIADSRSIRTTALAQRVTYYTTIAGGRAAVEGMRHFDRLEVYDLQGLHRRLAA